MRNLLSSCLLILNNCRSMTSLHASVNLHVQVPRLVPGSDDPSQQERWQFSEGKCVKVYLNYDLNDL